jgi:biotin carboxyl carrier protein
MSKFQLEVIGKTFEIELKKDESKDFTVSINGKDYNASLEGTSGSTMQIAVDGTLYFIELPNEPSQTKIDAVINDRNRIIESPDIFGSKKITISKETKTPKPKESIINEVQPSVQKPSTAAEGILAPMPGKVVAVPKNVGETVSVGDVVVILEAMKMENEITSNKDGKIAEVRVKEGDNVDAHDVLVVVG